MHPTDYYRLPWTFNDNVLAWLEPTKSCNLYCEGCYSANLPNSHKSLDQIRADLQAFVSQRRIDSVSIAGGEPLVHPHILDIVRMVRHDFHKKPVINTNGLALTPSLLRDLKQAGAFGFTFHVDSSQTRPGWKDKDEIALNALRLKLARMVADEGGLTCSFNATIFRRTLHHVPELVTWARDHIDIVHSMVFILFRTTRTQEYDYFAWGKPIDVTEGVYYDQDENPDPIATPEVIQTIRQRYPDFDAAAYLGGTKDPNSFKWLIAGQFGSPARDGRPGRIHGYAGPRYMEIMQVGHHLLKGSYLAYADPDLTTHGRKIMPALAPLDAGVRRAWGSWLKSAARRPATLREKVHFQTVLVIQPIDFMPNGEMNMCDGCPDITSHDGELVWSCRLEERLNHGVFYTAAPKQLPAGQRLREAISTTKDTQQSGQ